MPAYPIRAVGYTYVSSPAQRGGGTAALPRKAEGGVVPESPSVATQELSAIVSCTVQGARLQPPSSTEVVLAVVVPAGKSAMRVQARWVVRHSS